MLNLFRASLTTAFFIPWPLCRAAPSPRRAALFAKCLHGRVLVVIWKSFFNLAIGDPHDLPAFNRRAVMPPR